MYKASFTKLLSGTPSAAILFDFPCISNGTIESLRQNWAYLGIYIFILIKKISDTRNKQVCVYIETL